MKRLVLAATLAALSIAAACSLLDDPPPENTCETDMDCFRAQGEICNVDAGVCELGADAP